LGEEMHFRRSQTVFDGFRFVVWGGEGKNVSSYTGLRRLGSPLIVLSTPAAPEGKAGSTGKKGGMTGETGRCVTIGKRETTRLQGSLGIPGELPFRERLKRETLFCGWLGLESSGTRRTTPSPLQKGAFVRKR